MADFLQRSYPGRRQQVFNKEDGNKKPTGDP